MKKSILFLLFLSWAFNFARAQDPHFSQFFSSPLTLNPAKTGDFQGKLRAASNYRNQWPGFNKAYATTTLSVDAPILGSYIPENDRLSLGGVIMSDASGNGVLVQQGVVAGVAYSKGLNESHSISVGVQTSYFNFRFNPEKANFEDELSPLGFDLQTAESFFLNAGQRDLFDIHAGVQYIGKINEESLIYFGASAYHLNRTKVGLLDRNNQINIRYNTNAGGYTSLNPENNIHFSAQLQLQGTFRDYIYGVAWNRLLNARSNNFIQTYLGMWVRNNEFLIPYLSIDWNGFQVGFSHDIGFGTRKVSSTQYQSAEVSFIWVLSNAERNMSLNCPKF